MTLTSSSASPKGLAGLQQSWRKLYMRMRRRGMIDGYLKTSEYLDRFGLWHLHIIFRGSYVAQLWLSATWEKIHKAPVVYISRVWSAKVASYVSKVAGYMSKEGARYSWSKGWVFPGFVKVWEDAKDLVRKWSPVLHRREAMKLMISMWDDWLVSGKASQDAAVEFLCKVDQRVGEWRYGQPVGYSW